MTYPPQQPPQQPPWGQQPDPYGQGQQPDQYGPQSGGFPQQPQTGPQPTSSYQGFGTFSGGGGAGGPQPPKRNTSTIAAIVVGALIVLGGGGAAIFFLTKGDDNGGTADGKTTTQQTTTQPPTTTTTDPYDDSTTTETTTSDSTIAPDGTSPETVREDYITAYEQKSFASVVSNACSDYKSKYGTDTSEVEKEIEPFTITGTPVDDPVVTGDSALAKIDLEFSKGSGSPQKRSIKVKAVLEDGSWKFCGEAAG